MHACIHKFICKYKQSRMHGPSLCVNERRNLVSLYKGNENAFSKPICLRVRHSYLLHIQALAACLCYCPSFTHTLGKLPEDINALYTFALFMIQPHVCWCIRSYVVYSLYAGASWRAIVQGGWNLAVRYSNLEYTKLC